MACCQCLQGGQHRGDTCGCRARQAAPGSARRADDHNMGASSQPALHLIVSVRNSAPATMFGFYGMFGGEEYGPWGSATISRRAEGKLEDAKRIFDQHIAACDTSNGPVRGVPETAIETC